MKPSIATEMGPLEARASLRAVESRGMSKKTVRFSIV